MIEFSPSKISEIQREIDRCLQLSDSQPIAAFDADGTLWSCDMGEGLFKYQIKNKLLPDLPPDAWEYYLKMHEEKPAEAFLWLAQINAGCDLKTVQRWAQEAVDQWAELPVFKSLQTIMKHLHECDVDTYVVTASIKWAVEPAAALYDIPFDRVLGIATEVVNGKVTDKQFGPITWREGKVQGLLEKTGGRHPFLAAGNTSGDLPLLESATHLRLVLASAGPGHINHRTEQEMLQLAKKRQWMSHSFI